MRLKKNSIPKILAVAVFIFGFSIVVNFNSIKNQLFTAVLPSVLINLSNHDRLTAQLPKLTVNSRLQKAAQLKALDMATRGYFSHNTPEGQTPWYWLDLVGYNYASAGENLAVNFDDSSDVDLAWMNSPSHRENILNKKYTEIGIATAKGMYQGQEAVFVVQFFGKPAPLRENPLTLARANY